MWQKEYYENEEKGGGIMRMRIRRGRTSFWNDEEKEERIEHGVGG